MHIEYIKTYVDGSIYYYDENDRLVQIKYPNGKYEQREYHDNGVLKFRKFTNGKCERYNTNKQLIYRKYKNCEEIWTYNLDGKCIEYAKHVYYK
jgi:hypothetical protein